MATTRSFIVLCAFFSFVFCASVAEVFADTHAAASCSSADVSSAITAASRGDTVLVPAGSCSWSGRLSIPKGLHIKGAGIGNTVITGGIDYHPDATAISNDERFEVEGFTFNGGVGIGIYNSNQKPITNVVIHHNRLQNNNSSKVFDITGNVYGVAYLNQFSNWYTANFLGNGDSSWNNPFAYGDANNFYMEDNIFTDYNNNANGTMWVESGQGGRYTLRYNTFNGAGYTQGIDFWDIHGDQGDAGGMGGELYGNALINTNGNGGYRWLCHRGGKVLMFYNRHSGTASLGLDLQENHQCGPQQILNTYYWANFRGTTLLSASVSNDVGCLQQNRDWFTQPASFNGTVGVGCGTLASRPATCTTGVGYWATNQSCTNMTGLVGDISTYPTRSTIQGTFYKCTATNTWTEWYTPYTYPHPLRSGGSSDQTSPTASITAPTPGQTVTGSITVSANASDNVGVAGVQFKLDGANLGSEDTSSPYSIIWNTTQTSNGSHTLTATARDTSNNQTTSSGVTVTVNNVADTQAPTIPTNLSASAVSSSQINLTWTASTDNVGVTGYRIYRNGTQIGTSATNSYLDTGLSPSTTYTYTVSAYDGAGNNSSQSSSASAATQASSSDTTAPLAPTNLTATAISSTQINLSWTASTDNVGVTGYRIYRCQGTTCTPTTQIATSSTNSYQNTGLAASTAYRYRVRAYDAAGNISSYSSIASATTQVPTDATPPATPTGLGIQ